MALIIELKRPDTEVVIRHGGEELRVFIRSPLSGVKVGFDGPQSFEVRRVGKRV